jgi:hypothetical protein
MARKRRRDSPLSAAARPESAGSVIDDDSAPLTVSARIFQHLPTSASGLAPMSLPSWLAM